MPFDTARRLSWLNGRFRRSFLPFKAHWFYACNGRTWLTAAAGVHLFASKGRPLQK